MEPVTHTVTDRRIGRLPSGSDVTVPVHRYSGDAGPTVYVQAAQHGIELNGPAVLRRLHEWLLGEAIAGTVVSVPVVNPLAFDQRTYVTPAAFDARNPNLNRVWPGDDDGSLTERMAARLWDLLADADAVVDLHTGSPDMLEHVRFPADDPDAERLARVFGTGYRLTDRASEDRQADPDDDGAATDGQTLREAAAEAGVPAVVAELANSRQVSRHAVETGLDGLLNVLRQLDVLEGSPDPSPEQRLLRDAADPTVADVSGLFELRPDVAVGDRLDAGQQLGAIYSPSSFERRQTVTVADAGIAYSLTRESVVVSGERLAGLAVPDRS